MWLRGMLRRQCFFLPTERGRHENARAVMRLPLVVALSFARPPVRPPVMKVTERKLTVQIKGTEDTQALLALLRDGGRLKQGKGFNSVHLGATWGQLGKLSRSGGASERAWLRTHPDALAPLTERTTAMLPECSPRLLANVAHGMAAVAPADSAAWRELTRCATPAVLGQMKPMELASLGHALALAQRRATGETRLGAAANLAPLALLRLLWRGPLARAHHFYSPPPAPPWHGRRRCRPLRQAGGGGTAAPRRLLSSRARRPRLVQT